MIWYTIYKNLIWAALAFLSAVCSKFPAIGSPYVPGRPFGEATEGIAWIRGLVPMIDIIMTYVSGMVKIVTFLIFFLLLWRGLNALWKLTVGLVSKIWTGKND